MRFIVFIIFLCYYSLSFSQDYKVFTTEPEIQYDEYYSSLDQLRDSLIFFFAERKSYIPQKYNCGEKIFFTVDQYGLINDIALENNKSRFDYELYQFLKEFEFEGPILKYYNGTSFNIRLLLFIEYSNLSKLLTIKIDHIYYWNNDSFHPVCKFSGHSKLCDSIKSQND
ncbi:MAG: hypothetical protein ACOYEA_02850 [Fermentimonas sp.]|jgi:hypothetical protein